MARCALTNLGDFAVVAAEAAVGGQEDDDEAGSQLHREFFLTIWNRFFFKYEIKKRTTNLRRKVPGNDLERRS